MYPEALQRIENHEVREFVELCLCDHKIRLDAEDLIHHPFLDTRFVGLSNRLTVQYSRFFCFVFGSRWKHCLSPVLGPISAAAPTDESASRPEPVTRRETPPSEPAEAEQPEEQQDSSEDNSYVSSLVWTL